MKKTLIALLMVLLSVMLVVSCNDKVNNDDNADSSGSGTNTATIIPNEVGETVKLGKTPEGKEVKWIVLDINEEGKTALLISKDVLEKRIFDDAKATNDYIGSSIQTYLNGDFITTYGLSKDNIQKVKITQADIEKANKDDSGDNYVYLLSKSEAEKYFTSNDKRIAYLGDTAYTWWLRSPIENKSTVYAVWGDGAFHDDLPVTSEYGLRPVFWYKWN